MLVPFAQAEIFWCYSWAVTNCVQSSSERVLNFNTVVWYGNLGGKAKLTSTVGMAGRIVGAKLTSTVGMAGRIIGAKQDFLSDLYLTAVEGETVHLKPHKPWLLQQSDRAYCWIEPMRLIFDWIDKMCSCIHFFCFITLYILSLITPQIIANYQQPG